MVDNRNGKLLQGKSLVKTRKETTVSSPVCQRVPVGNVNFVSFNSAMAVGHAIHTRLQAQFLNGGPNRFAEVWDGAHFRDIGDTVRDGQGNWVRRYGEIKPAHGDNPQRGRGQIAGIPMNNRLIGHQFTPIPLNQIDPRAQINQPAARPNLVNLYNQLARQDLINQFMALIQNPMGNHFVTVVPQQGNDQGLYLYHFI